MILKRSFHYTAISLSKYKKQYNPALIPPPSALSQKLEWLRIRPEPAITEKTIKKKLADCCILHEVVKKKPLYAYVNPDTVSPEVLEAVLPPKVEDHVHGMYGPRDLSKEEMIEMRSLRKEDTEKWNVKTLAEKFKCSKAQVVAITRLPRKSSKNRRWKWWFGKRYESAQVDYYQDSFNKWRTENASLIKEAKKTVQLGQH